MSESFEPPYLTDDEIAAICDPLVMPGAQYRHLVRLGLFATKKPNGRPLVARSEFERVLGAARMTGEQHEAMGDISALRARWRDKHGTQTQGR